MENGKYLELLGKTYKNIQEVSEEIINLQAILNLPKGTELFLSDIHGEYEAFIHILNNGSGIIKNKIEDIYKDSITEKDRKELATVIYYPEEKLNLVKKDWGEDDNVYFTFESIDGNGNCVISVREGETTREISVYTVNIKTGTLTKE